MLSPEYLRRITEGAEENASKLHQKIIALIISRMVRRLERREEYLFTPIDRWQIDTIQESGYLLEDIQTIWESSTKRLRTEWKRQV